MSAVFAEEYWNDRSVCYGAPVLQGPCFSSHGAVERSGFLSFSLTIQRGAHFFSMTDTTDKKKKRKPRGKVMDLPERTHKFKTRAPAGMLTEQDAAYVVSRLNGEGPKQAVKSAGFLTDGHQLKKANEIDKRVTDPNGALNKAFDARGVSAELLADYAIELLRAETVIKMKDQDGADYLTKISDNRTRLNALELVIKLRNMMPANKDVGNGNTNITFEQTVIMAADMMKDPQAMQQLMDRAKVITAEYTEVKEGG